MTAQEASSRILLDICLSFAYTRCVTYAAKSRSVAITASGKSISAQASGELGARPMVKQLVTRYPEAIPTQPRDNPGQVPKSIPKLLF